MTVFNPDRFFKRRTIFSSENFGPGDQNFQDQNSRDRTSSCTCILPECSGDGLSLTPTVPYFLFVTVPTDRSSTADFLQNVQNRRFMQVGKGRESVNDTHKRQRFSSSFQRETQSIQANVAIVAACSGSPPQCSSIHMPNEPPHKACGNSFLVQHATVE